MNQAVAKAPTPLAPVEQNDGSAIIAMIERAARDPNVDIDKMQRLLDMRANESARLARVAYSAALSQLQPELPVIVERGRIGLSTDNKKNPTYARWEDINEAIKPVLARHGFALSFRTGSDGDKIMVTGILSHRDGHSEETTMHLPIDTGPGRNAVQSIGSSTSYGKRYTAGALLNLTSRGEDDDGNAAGIKKITEEQAMQIVDLLEANSKDRARFLKWAKVERVEDIAADHFDSCLEAIKAPKK